MRLTLCLDGTLGLIGQMGLACVAVDVNHVNTWLTRFLGRDFFRLADRGKDFPNFFFEEFSIGYSHGSAAVDQG